MVALPELESPVRVLVVDDFRPIADYMAAALCEDGYDGRAAYSAEEAFQVAEEFRPQALVTDAILPDKDGWTFGAEMETRFPGCKVLLVSADIYLHQPPPGAPDYKLVRKAMLLDELPLFLESCKASQAAGRGQNH